MAHDAACVFTVELHPVLIPACIELAFEAVPFSGVQDEEVSGMDRVSAAVLRFQLALAARDVNEGKTVEGTPFFLSKHVGVGMLSGRVRGMRCNEGVAGIENIETPRDRFGGLGQIAGPCFCGSTHR